MVLTNLELWAVDGTSASSLPLEFETAAHNRHLNPFDPRGVPAQVNANITHFTSNGYYGFSYINAAHTDVEELNNNNNNNNVNDMHSTMTSTANITPQTHAASAMDFGSAVNVAGNVVNVTRCKKRFFVMNAADECTATNNNNDGCDVSAKRCRFDDDFAAQYCNDFFSLPSTQIATQSCLMDTEEVIQTPQHQYPIQQQQQVDEAMFENNNNNIEKYEQNLHLQLQEQQQQQQSQIQITTQTPPSQHQQQQSQQQQQQYLYHQQQHYQDMITTVKCHFNNFCDTLTLNNHSTCKIDSQTSENWLKSHNQNNINENVANDFKVDDATLFAQIHGGCLHHFVNNTITYNNNNKDVVKNYLQDDNYCEEF